YVNQYGLSRKHIFDSVKHSLRRLGLDYIDALQRSCNVRHRFDPNTPIQETASTLIVHRSIMSHPQPQMQALHDVVKAGYARYIGMSACYAWQFHVMQNYAITNKLTPFISIQNQYSLLYREDEREMLPTLKLNAGSYFGVGFIPWSSIARSPARPPSSPNGRKRTRMLIYFVEEISKKRGISMVQVAVAWVLFERRCDFNVRFPVSAPIVGTTSLTNLADIVVAIDVQLTEAEIKNLEEPYQPMAISGH
ncbi:NADP-dependent oxidoreductase domain-containing protein, partial [Mycena olivaceomarginata]